MVVVAKAALTLLALVLATTARARHHTWSEIKASPAMWLLAYLLVATVGGLLYGDAQAGLVLVVRVALVAAVPILAVRAYGWELTFSALLAAMLLVGLVAAGTGVGTLADGRLGGGIPPLSPNAIALLINLPLLCIVWRLLIRSGTWLDVYLAVPLLALVWATGSRTGLAALVVSCLVMVLLVRRLSIPVFTVIMLTIPTVAVTAASTGVLSAYLTRGDAGSVATLSSRTVAWSAALDYADSFGERLFGAGLAVKSIPVSAMYRSEQILDSTWISAIVQAGVLGTTVLVLLVLNVAGHVLRTSRPYRLLGTGVFVYLIVTSILESGMFDASVLFVAFMSLALCAPSEHDLKHERTRAS